MGGRFGWQPTLGPVRLQVLANVGMHDYADVGGGFLSSTSPDSLQTPFVGGELGIRPRRESGNGWEVGFTLLVRRDIEKQETNGSKFRTI